MGLCRTAVLVFSMTLRTRPLGPGRVFITRPKGHEFLGAVWSTLKFLLVLTHFCRCCIKERYSVVHRCQERSARYWTCFHRLLAYKSSFLKSPGGKRGLDFNCRRWFGVRGSRSFVSPDTVVMGRSLRIHSTLQKAACYISSSNVCCFKTESSIFFY